MELASITSVTMAGDAVLVIREIAQSVVFFSNGAA
jgi:hypothetical protein